VAVEVNECRYVIVRFCPFRKLGGTSSKTSLEDPAPRVIPANRETLTRTSGPVVQPADLTQGRMTYKLRPLRLHAMIERIPKRRHRVTDLGLSTAWFFTPTYSRILRPGLGRILPEPSQSNGLLRRCFDELDQKVKSWVEEAKLAPENLTHLVAATLGVAFRTVVHRYNAMQKMKVNNVIGLMRAAIQMEPTTRRSAFPSRVLRIRDHALHHAVLRIQDRRSLSHLNESPLTVAARNQRNNEDMC
jgi:hypothetical protein